MSEFVTFHDLKDKSVYITGGGSGIGASLTEGFLEAGAKVAFVGREDASEFVYAIGEKYGTAPTFIKCDITDVGALQASIDQAVDANGDISVLVNNAANDTRHTLDDYTVDQWDAGMDVNLRPHFFTAQAVVEGMRRAGGGSIINYSSISYMMGNAGYPAYATSKAAIVGLTRALSAELGPDRIRVNALLPGWVMTERQKRLWATPEALEEHLKSQNLPDLIQPRDVVDATLFLASKASQMVTGQAIVVDGGTVVTG